jgi:hypothetical protein
MDHDPVLADLEQVERRLQDEIAIIPEVRMLEEVRDLIARRKTMKAIKPDEAVTRLDQESVLPEGDLERRSLPTKQRLPVYAQVQNLAADYLRSIQRRAKSSEIGKEVLRRGVRAGNPDNITSTVSGYLSSAKDRFDNVKGEGYGLVEWQSGASAPASERLGVASPVAAADISRTPIQYSDGGVTNLHVRELEKEAAE